MSYSTRLRAFALWPLGCLTLALLPRTASGQTAPAPATSTSADEPVKLSVFQVTSARDKGYGATDSIAGSRVDTPTHELSSDTITINEALIKDVGTIGMLDVLPYVSGMTPAGTGYADTQYSIRGYASAGTGFRDGLPDTETGSNVSPDDTVSYDRLEVLKGPAGVLYGATSMGGIVNKVSKMPSFIDRTDVQLIAEAGAEDIIRGTVDTQMALGSDKNTAIRVALDDQRGHRSWGGVDDDYNIYTAMKHQFGPDNRSAVWGRFLYYNYNTDPNQGEYFLDKDGKVPTFQRGDARNHSNFAPLKENAQTIDRSFELGYSTSFEAAGTQWSLRLLGRYGLASGDKDPSPAAGTISAVDSTGAVIGTNANLSINDPRIADWRTTMTLRAFEGFNRYSFENLDLAGKFDTWFANHTLILNTSGTYNESQRTFEFWNVLFPNAPKNEPANTFSIINYAQDLSGLTIQGIRASGSPIFNAQANNSTLLGWSAGGQDSIAFFNRTLIAIVGARFDWDLGAARLLNQNLAITSITNTTNQDWTHKFGLVYQTPINGLSLYVQDATTFVPINQVNSATGAKFPNQEGLDKEVGFKIDMFDHRLISTTSVFDMTLTNVIIGVVNPPSLGGGTVNVPAGTQNTKGWETDLTYEPINGLDAVVAFSNIDSTNAQGKGFRGVPETATYSGFVKYTFQTGPIQNFGASVGYQHYGKKPVDATDTFRLGETDQTNAGIYYNAPGDRWSVQLNVLNVFDAEKPFTSVSAASVVLQFPRSYRLSINYRF